MVQQQQNEKTKAWIHHMEGPLKGSWIILWKSGSIFLPWLLGLISSTLVTEGTKNWWTKKYFKRQVHHNSSSNPLLMTSVRSTEAARNKDAGLVIPRTAGLGRHKYPCTWGTQFKRCWSGKALSRSPRLRLNLHWSAGDASKPLFPECKCLK